MSNVRSKQLRGTATAKVEMQRLVTVAMVLVTLLLATASSTAAQTDQEHIDQLHARALALQEDQTKLWPAARLYIQEANLRGADDAQSVKCLTVAAHLLYYTKRQSEARRVMERAAGMALEQGDVGSAADIYLLTAWIAAQSGKNTEAARLARRAEVLAASPLLASVESASIMSRVRRVQTIGPR